MQFLGLSGRNGIEGSMETWNPGIPHERPKLTPLKLREGPSRGIFFRVCRIHLIDVGKIDYGIRLEGFCQEYRIVVGGATWFPSGRNEDGTFKGMNGSGICDKGIGTFVSKNCPEKLPIQSGGSDADPVLGFVVRGRHNCPVRFLVFPRRSTPAHDEDKFSVRLRAKVRAHKDSQLF